MVGSTLFIGQLIHSKGFDELEVIAKGFILVQEDGKVRESLYINPVNNYRQMRTLQISATGPFTEKAVEQLPAETKRVVLTEDQFLVPGFIDCHIHAPQFPNIGLGLDMELLDWLNSYTFPLEVRYSDDEFARHVYAKVINRTLRSGTTTACYFGTNHRSGTFILAKEAVSQGQRAFVGKVSANCNIPDNYR